MERALAAFDVRDKLKCDHESEFIEMHEALGDGKAQEEIRRSSPGARHCQLLVQSAEACRGCPHNPFAKLKIAEPEPGWRALANQSLELAEKSGLHLLDVDLKPEAVLAARYGANYLRMKRDELLAERLAGKLGELIARMMAR